VFNRSIDEISSMLDFRPLASGEAALYSESSPSGNIGVVENHTAEKSIVSLELLFNAATLSKNEVKRLFNQ
jgi:hypothetical protein